MSTTRSYAQAASAPSRKPVKTNHVVIVQPKESLRKQNVDVEMLEEFQQALMPNVLKNEKICIHNKKVTRNRMVVSCASEQQCKAVCSALDGNLIIEASMPKRKNPLVQILGVDPIVDKKDIFDLILSQNAGFDGFSGANFLPKFEKTDKVGTKFVVAEVEPRLYFKLIESKRVCVGYSSCLVKGHIRVIRCFKCNRFGHFQRECRNEATCAECAGSHETKCCDKQEQKCSNCQWVNGKRTERKEKLIDIAHCADDPECPQYRRMLRIVENRYDFG